MATRVAMARPTKPPRHLVALLEQHLWMRAALGGWQETNRS
jgi:hypothetical protein